jgi:hypothetical protein
VPRRASSAARAFSAGAVAEVLDEVELRERTARSAHAESAHSSRSARVGLELEAAAQVRDRADRIAERLRDQRCELELELELALLARARQLAAQERRERLRVAAAAIEIAERVARAVIVRKSASRRS